MDDTPTSPLFGGRYRLLRRLGRGGMSDVHVARDEVLGRDVAIKVLRGDQVEDPAGVARLEREARAVAQLTHPHVVVVHDVLQDQAGAAVVMELVEGETLADRIRREAPLPWRDAVELAAAVADGLGAAHAVGLVHRDVKPSNVLLGTDGRVKVADFGIAGLAHASSHTTTVRGSIPYLAPEQARGERPDPRTDVYALGCVLHEMLTGRPPFADDHGAAIIGQHMHRAPDPPSRHVDDLPPAVDDLVLWMLAKEPADRPADMAAVRAELDRLADGGGRSRDVTAVLAASRAPAAAETPTEVVTPTRSPHTARRSGRGAVVLGVTGVALVAALLIGWATRGPGGDGAPGPAASTGDPAAAATTPPATTPPTTAPTPTPEPTTEPTDPGPPARPETVPEAAETFRRTLVAGRDDGLASGKAVEELDKLVTEIVAKDREGKDKDVRDGARKLDEQVVELVEKGELSESLGDDLQEAAREFRRLA